MAISPASPTPPEGEPTASRRYEIATAVVLAYKDVLGRGPTKASVQFAGADTLVVVLQDTMTAEERKLASLGKSDLVRECRPVPGCPMGKRVGLLDALSLAGMLPDARAVIVTTPQEAARTVAQRAGALATRSQLRVAGVIENMASFVCPCCGENTDIFGAGGGEELADALGVRLLARVPVATALRASGDQGVPLVLSDPSSPATTASRCAAERLLNLAATPARPETNLAVERSVST